MSFFFIIRNPLERVVKLHDLEDSMNIFRLRELDLEMAIHFNN